MTMIRKGSPRKDNYPYPRAPQEDFSELQFPAWMLERPEARKKCTLLSRCIDTSVQAILVCICALYDVILIPLGRIRQSVHKPPMDTNAPVDARSRLLRLYYEAINDEELFPSALISLLQMNSIETVEYLLKLHKHWYESVNGVYDWRSREVEKDILAGLSRIEPRDAVASTLFDILLNDVNLRREAAIFISRLRISPRDIREKVSLYFQTMGNARAIVALADEEGAKALPLVMDRIPSYMGSNYDPGEVIGALSAFGTEAAIYLVPALMHNDVRIREITGNAIELMNWQPLNLDQKVSLALCLRDINELVRIGSIATPNLLAFLSRTSSCELSYWWERISAARALMLIGDPEASEAVLDFLIEDSHCSPHQGGLRKRWLREEMGNIFGDYRDLIREAFSYGYNIRHVRDGRDLVPEYAFDKVDCLTATSELCKLNTPVASNIIHKIAKRADESFVSYENEEKCQVKREEIKFDDQRHMAMEELLRRGNPEYDSRAYTQRGAWRF